MKNIVRKIKIAFVTSKSLSTEMHFHGVAGAIEHKKF